MSRMQDDFFEQVGRNYGLERGNAFRRSGETKTYISAGAYGLRGTGARGRKGASTSRSALNGSAKKQHEHAPKNTDEQRQNWKEVEQLQGERQAQHKSLLQLTEAANNKQKEVKRLDYTLQEQRSEFEAITADIKQAG